MSSNNDVTLKDVYDIAHRIEDNINNNLKAHSDRMTLLEGRTGVVEQRTSAIEGKASNTSVFLTMGVSVIGLVMQIIGFPKH